MATSRPLDNSNPTVYSTAQLVAHKDTKSTPSEQLAAIWNSLIEDGEQMECSYSGANAEPSPIKAHRIEPELREDIDEQEVFDLLRSITDPEHPLTLEQLAVVSPSQIQVSNRVGKERVLVTFTPTVTHCGLVTLIGLTLRVRLLRALPPRYKVDIRIQKGMHESENAVNKQLNDKERVQAALENSHLLGVVEGCLSTAHKRGEVIATQ